MVFCEFLITFSLEVRVVWCRKWRLPTVLFFCIRYNSIVYAALTLASRSNLEIIVRIHITRWLCMIVTDGPLIRGSSYD